MKISFYNNKVERMQELKSKATELNGKYAEQLKSLGIKTVISKKYFETDVEELTGGYHSTGSAIFYPIERALNRKREKNKGYNYQPNRFHCLVLSVMPVEQRLVKKDDCREYAFIVSKVTRPHVGTEPHQVTYKEEKVLTKIEKRLLKIIKKATKKPAQKVCKNTFRDAVRYSFSQKYEHKTEYCGKECYTWDMIFLALAVAICFLLIASAWAAGELYRSL